MAKRFFFICAGVLMLAIAYQFGVDSARADWDTSVPGAIVGGDHFYWYTSAGDAWSVSQSGWTRSSEGDLPVPSSEVKFLFRDCCSGSLVTYDDVAWYWESQVWTNLGAFPGGPIGTKPSSFGSIKGAYR